MHAERRRRHGFTMLELMVVIAIVGIFVAMAVPSFRAIRANNRLRDAAGDVADALALARSNAIASGDQFVVYFDTGILGGTDTCGNPLLDTQGNPVPILVFDDANANCCIDAGEASRTLPAAEGVQWGVDFATVKAPGDDDPFNNFASGTTFRNNGAASAAEWVLFSRDGIPRPFGGGGAGCNKGTQGDGGGAIYLNNDRRDIAVVLEPLGAVKVRAWEAGGAQWK